MLKFDGDTVVLRGGGYSVFASGMFAFIGLLGLIPFSKDPTGFGLVGGAAFLAMAVICIRYRLAEVRAEQGRLVLRTPWRTTTLPWDHVKQASVAPTNGNRLFVVVKVATTDGRAIKVDGPGCRWAGEHNDQTEVGRMVAEINRRRITPIESAVTVHEASSEVHHRNDRRTSGFTDLASQLHEAGERPDD